MKLLNAENGQFGPFSSITIENDHYFCDGLILPFSVTGDGQINDVQFEEKITVPEKVKPLQLDLALIEFNMYDVVHNYVKTGTTEEQARFNRAEWMYRNDTFLVNGAHLLGLTDEQIDEIFIIAATK